MKHAWKVKQASILVVIVAAGWSGAEAAPYIDDTVQDQWFTGSLESPSPALTKAGTVAVEPYATTPAIPAPIPATGTYRWPNDLNQMQPVTFAQIRHHRPAEHSSGANFIKLRVERSY